MRPSRPDHWQVYCQIFDFKSGTSKKPGLFAQFPAGPTIPSGTQGFLGSIGRWRTCLSRRVR